MDIAAWTHGHCSIILKILVAIQYPSCTVRSYHKGKLPQLKTWQKQPEKSI